MFDLSELLNMYEDYYSNKYDQEVSRLLDLLVRVKNEKDVLESL